jgi:hypothetical protein
MQRFERLPNNNNNKDNAATKSWQPLNLLSTKDNTRCSMDVIEFILNSLRELQQQVQHVLIYKQTHPQSGVTFFNNEVNIQQLQFVNTFLTNAINEFNGMLDNAHKENQRVNK